MLRSSPGCTEIRSRKTLTIFCLPSFANTWVSDPVGSVTVTVVFTPPLPRVKCSGLMP